MRIVVLGSNGRLGSMVLECVRGALTVYEKQGLKHVVLEGMSRSELDISNTDHLTSFLESCHDNTCIINCAAITNVSKIEHDYAIGIEDALLVNAKPLYHLANWCSIRDNKSVIHMSTPYVFPSGEYSSDCVNMETTIDGCYYGETKRRGELYLITYSGNYSIIRFDNLYGGSSSSKVFIEKIVDQLVSDTLRLTVTNKQLTRPTSTLLLAMNIAELAINRLKNTIIGAEILHPFYESDIIVTYNELAKEIARKAEIDKPIYSEDDGYKIESNVTRPNSILKGNWIIGSSYSMGLRSCINNYMYDNNYKPRPKRSSRH